MQSPVPSQPASPVCIRSSPRTRGCSTSRNSSRKVCPTTRLHGILDRPNIARRVHGRTSARVGWLVMARRALHHHRSHRPHERKAPSTLRAMAAAPSPGSDAGSVASPALLQSNMNARTKDRDQSVSPGGMLPQSVGHHWSREISGVTQISLCLHQESVIGSDRLRPLDAVHKIADTLRPDIIVMSLLLNPPLVIRPGFPPRLFFSCARTPAPATSSKRRRCWRWTSRASR